MKLTRIFWIALAIAAVLVCGGLTRAQDANSSWLLRAPQIFVRRNLELSPAGSDLANSRASSRLQSPANTDSTSSSARPAPTLAPRPTTGNDSRPDGHRFWDTTNDLLFAGVAASRTLDYFSTLNMRRRGRDEF